MQQEICNECGADVSFGSGLYVNRVADLNEIEDRIEMGKPYPEGNFICPECEEAINELSANFDNNIQTTVQF